MGPTEPAQTQLAGGLIGLGVAASVFTNKLADNLQQLAPTASPLVLVSVSAIYNEAIVPLALRASIIEAYMRCVRATGRARSLRSSIRQVFIMGVPTSILMICGALVVRPLRHRDRR